MARIHFGEMSVCMLFTDPSIHGFSHVQIPLQRGRPRVAFATAPSPPYSETGRPGYIARSTAAMLYRAQSRLLECHWRGQSSTATQGATKKTTRKRKKRIEEVEK